MKMIPGFNKIAKQVGDIDDSAFAKVEAIIDSMTPYERANPEAINTSRKNRLAKGSGNGIIEVNQFLKQLRNEREDRLIRSM